MDTEHLCQQLKDQNASINEKWALMSVWYGNGGWNVTNWVGDGIGDVNFCPFCGEKLNNGH